jgi:hypothetical protein
MPSAAPAALGAAVAAPGCMPYMSPAYPSASPVSLHPRARWAARSRTQAPLTIYAPHSWRRAGGGARAAPLPAAAEQPPSRQPLLEAARSTAEPPWVSRPPPRPDAQAPLPAVGPLPARRPAAAAGRAQLWRPWTHAVPGCVRAPCRPARPAAAAPDAAGPPQSCAWRLVSRYGCRQPGPGAGPLLPAAAAACPARTAAAAPWSWRWLATL